MSLHLVRLAECAPQPWRNGGGTTRELLRWPAGNADSPDWILRISVAEIERDGPFSAFPDVARWFAVLQGAGVRLSTADGPVGAGGEPVHFAGEAAPMCHLVDGPTRDLNLMQRRSSGRAMMRRAASGSVLDVAGRWRALYAHEPVHIDSGSGAVRLDAATLLWSEAPAATSWRLIDGGLAYWMSLQP